MARAVKNAPISSATASTTAAATTPASAARAVGPESSAGRFLGCGVVPGFGVLGVFIQVFGADGPADWPAGGKDTA